MPGQDDLSLENKTCLLKYTQQLRLHVATSKYGNYTLSG